MTEKNLIILTDPSDVGDDSAAQYGTLDLNTVSRATNLANDAFATAEEVKDVPDDMITIREAINKLADAVGLLTEQLYQVGVGVREGRITVIEVVE